MSTMPNKNTPVASGSSLKYLTPFGDAYEAIGNDSWYQWLNGDSNTKFYCDGYPWGYTARREKRRKGFFWYAYMKRDEVLYKVYMGKTEKLTPEYIFKTIPQKLDDKYYSR